MKFPFDPNLDDQVNAVPAVGRLFEGTQVQSAGFGLVLPNGVVANRLTLTDDRLLANLQAVQRDPEPHNGSPISCSET